MRQILIMILALLCSCAPKLSEYATKIKIHREHYKQEFLTEERAPLRTLKEVNKLDFFSVNEEYACLCDLAITQEKKAFEMPTYSGISKPFYIYAIASCPIKGRMIKLQLYQSVKQNFTLDMNNLLFLPFKDLSNGDLTYGGGRYIDLKMEDINDGKLLIDFNKCYNPWCAYSDGYNCPIPPKANHLDMSIEAGEKMYQGEKIHK